MKNFMLLLLACMFGLGLFAQSRRNHVLVGFQSGVVSPIYLSNLTLKKIKLGLPTFSYAASVEKRFSIHNKLNFSFEYSMNYYRLNQVKAAQTSYYLKNQQAQLNANIRLNAHYQLDAKNSLSVGGGVTHSMSHVFINPSNNFMDSKTKKFSLKDVNPNLMLGIEHKTKLFNSNLYYSIQYNIGFFPSSRSIQYESTEPITPAAYQGIFIGLKYEY